MTLHPPDPQASAASGIPNASVDDTEASLFARLNRHLDAVQAALVGANADALVAACRALADALSAEASATQRALTPAAPAGTGRAAPANLAPQAQRLDATQAALIDQRLKLLRQTIQAQGAATERALGVLFPQQQSAVYSGKSAFGGTPRLGPGKSYQA